MLENKTVIVTGASSGIGREVARLICESGGKVIAVDRNEPDFTVHSFHPADLGNQASIDDLVDRLPAEVDGLANIAGLPPTRAPSDVVSVNFVGLTYLTKRLVPKLADGASIVNLGALAGFDWQSNLPLVRKAFALDFSEVADFCAENGISKESSYQFSKQALVAWTFANKWTWRNRSIRVNTVSPGPVQTPILKDFLDTLGKRAEEDMQLRGAGRPEQIAPAVAFLLSEQAAWITGVNLPVDGGMYAHVVATQNALS